jgi:hypothetical protein
MLPGRDQHTYPIDLRAHLARTALTIRPTLPSTLMSTEVANEDAFPLVVLVGLATVPEGAAWLVSVAMTLEAQSANNEI